MEQERRAGNEYIVDLSVEYSPADPLRLLEDTISYAELYEIVKTEMQTPRNLLECVAGHIAKRVKDLYPIISRGEVTLTKTTPPIAGITGEASVGLSF